MPKTFSLKANFNTTGGRHHKVVEFFARIPGGMRAPIVKEMLLKYIELMEDGKVPRISFDDDFFSNPAEVRNDHSKIKQMQNQTETAPENFSIKEEKHDSPQDQDNDITSRLLEAIDSDF